MLQRATGLNRGKRGGRSWSTARALEARERGSVAVWFKHRAQWGYSCMQLESRIACISCKHLVCRSLIQGRGMGAGGMVGYAQQVELRMVSRQCQFVMPRAI